MSNDLGEAGRLSVTSFCGPVGRRESYQLDDPKGYVQFTYEEFQTIKDLVESWHAELEAKKPR